MNSVSMKIYACKNCGIRRSQDCFNCQTCGFYDHESEEYHSLLNIERVEIDKTNRIFLEDYLIKKGFEGIKGYDAFIKNVAKKHRLFVILTRVFFVLIGFYYFFKGKMISGIIIGISGWLLGSIYRWKKFGKADKMDDWNLTWNNERCASYHVLSRYKENRKIMNNDIEQELDF